MRKFSSSAFVCSFDIRLKREILLYNISLDIVQIRSLFRDSFFIVYYIICL